MSKYRHFSEAEAEVLAERIGMELTEGEAKSAAGYSDVDIYETLETTPIDSLRDRGGDGDTFITSPYRPPTDDNPYNAWITRFELERDDASGVLAGVRVGVKDNIAVRGVETTNASHGFEGIVPGEHATVVDRLLEAGARLRGKTNLDEMAMGPTSESSAYGPSTNPVDPNHVAGGSSGGSGAAVAAGDVDFALGSDTGGSIRIPASYCGVVGLKPTHGRVPKRGFFTQGDSLEDIGPMAVDVETAAKAMDVIADAPGGKRITNEGNRSFATDIGTDLDNVTVGVLENYFDGFATDAVATTVRDAVADLELLGASVTSIEIPELQHVGAAWWGIGPVEFAAAYLTNDVGLWRRRASIESLTAGFERVRRGSSADIGTVPKEVILLGAHLLYNHGARHYTRAQNLRTALTEVVDEALAEVDVLVAPSTPTTALELGAFGNENMPSPNGSLAPANVTGHPALSVPCGEVENLPVGMQLVGAWHDDGTLLDVAYEYERNA
ncbi:amidase [Haladaptatus halobius]|uniref:amidase n=1 Tax=Haladaptatus halobius TaxID=2884875 RepID=UPI001D0A8253|nr:amidase family protein [Haladaptatus halobius]